jgi:endonuclease/exonuclease/phosphatase family metal-dependent hydrolase
MDYNDEGSLLPNAAAGGSSMPAITDPPPADVALELAALSAALDAALPVPMNGRVLIATWNIRAFGSLTRKWRSDPGDSPRRDLASALYIAQILSRFDVVAVQEVKANLRALRDVLKALGPDWSFVLTDVTQGDPGNEERLAFLFKTQRVKLSGLACELVVPEDIKSPFANPANAFQRQFVRTPYAVSFLSGDKTFVLVTLHVVFGKKGEDRRQELEAIAKWLRNWAERMDDFGQNLICLGDFNIDRAGDPQFEALTSTGLTPVPDHAGLPRTIFDEAGPSDLNNFFDQIAWFQTVKGKPYLTLKYERGGNFDFRGLVMPGLTNQELSWRLSDHLPLWAEFST